MRPCATPPPPQSLSSAAVPHHRATQPLPQPPIRPGPALSPSALLPYPLSDGCLTDAVESLPDPDLALAFLSWSRSHFHHNHDDSPVPAPTPIAHSALLRFLAHSGRFDAVDATRQDISLAGVLPTRACLGALVAAYVNAGMEGKATDMCELVRGHHGMLPAASTGPPSRSTRPPPSTYHRSSSGLQGQGKEWVTIGYSNPKPSKDV